MKGLINKLKVPATSTLVLHYADSVHDTGLEREYLDQLDFNNIDELVKSIAESCKNLDKIILFRKLYVRNFFKRIYADEAYPQVVSLGAGWDPTSLHLIKQYPMLIQDIFEVDLASMVEKSILYKNIMPECNSLHFIECDLMDHEKLIKALTLSGYRSIVPTVIVFEGVIHYITDEVFRSILRQFKTADKRNVFIMDFTLSEESVPLRGLEEHQRCLQIVGKYVEGKFNTHMRSEITALIEEAGGEIISIESMRDIEYKIHHKNEIFLEDGEGIEEMLAFRL
ncbi:class I SAM-dependent methyltransferase [Pedobacter cryoconitis]|uniref:O-methyltransferase involved in polyketide biosynthesis n=1 Tax=Pedobacter cryoconitis TaxID=188932 RepID=A0A7X0MHF1_9SPHI|nr:class I SAM-dependent methyltransferase [Pedobacter cryoconitis]MBB6498781.1 O-methyltransferase involved in polyketide biosynthesis [Pedobacter cryoconitis]